MYGEDKYTVIFSHCLSHFEKRNEKQETKLAAIATLLSLFYCFEKKSLCLMF
jgi:hypothetical protein